MKKVTFEIPQESFTLVKYISHSGLPAVAAVNKSLLKFKNKKDVFPYVLSLWIEFQDVTDAGMPSGIELKKAEDFEDEIYENMKGGLPFPNVLLVGRLTSNGVRDFFYRVHNAELVHEYLQTLITQNNYPIKFDYTMDVDIKGDAEKELSKFLKLKR